MLHHVVEFGVMVGIEIENNFNLEVFEMSIGTNEPTNELVNRKL
jgi:hypothetical protein